MSETLSTGSLKTLFRFPFRQPGWQSRFMVGSLLSVANYVIPILPSIWTGGYLVRIVRQTVRGEEPALPAWDDWAR